jgi:hypothetical protein
VVFLIKVWDGEIMKFEGYSKRIPKEGQDFKAWTITKDANGTVQQASFSPARYRITYEETNG